MMNIKSQKENPFERSFIVPNVATPGTAPEGVPWLTHKLNQAT
jgi:hypothetical protein